MKKNNFLLVLLFITANLFGQSPGQLISYEKNLDLTPGGVTDFINSHIGTTTNPDVLNFLHSVNFGIKAYKIMYYTTNENNQLVRASGLLMYPKTGYKLSTIVSTHPTTDHRSHVPSNLSGIFELGFLLELNFVLNGYVLMAPDYVGMGSGDGVHPYVHNDTEASATLDFIKAANTVAAQLSDLKRYDEYFITGYSQGGHASMATIKKAAQTNQLKFKYMFTGAGPFDLSYSTLKLGLLDKEIYPASAFTANLMYNCKMSGYNVYTNSPNEIIAPDYQQLFTDRVINEGGGLLWGPFIWRKLYKDSFITAVTNNQNHPLRQCLRANDNYDWYNKTPSTFGYADPDLIVNPNSSRVAKDVQRNYYPWYSLDKYQIDNLYWGPLGHIGGVVPYLFAVPYKFNSLRKGGFFNQWAAITSKNGNTENQHFISDISKSQIVAKVDNSMEVLSISDVNSETKSLKNGSNDLSSLNDGVYLLQVLRNGETQYVPYVKKTPETIDANEAIKSETKENLVLNLKAEDLDHVNIIDENMQIVKTISNEEYTEKGISISDLSANQTYTFEVITPQYSVQFKKLISNQTNNELYVFNQKNQIGIKASQNILSIKVISISGQVVYQAKNVNAISASSSNLASGVYVVQVELTNGSTQTKKIVL